ncbi:MAG: glycosyltransferase family 2 protein [Deltaproteobacteria bacterium]|nr:MAG: glycosyltransferase family 2 protein [Deltaproteobacteria bacterium]
MSPSQRGALDGGVRLCAIVPTYDNPRTIRGVVEALRAYVEDVIVVDDGSGPEGRAAVEALGREGLARVEHRARNGGKGAAVKTGLSVADRLGFTHALQVDADGQHDLSDVPRMTAAMRAHPDALVLGAPRYDESAPTARLHGRKTTKFWTDFETFGEVIEDPMCGFRIYPVQAALAARARGDRMDFDIEIAVRMAWAGVPVVNVPTQVRYVAAEEGGVSHFQLVRDNVRISLLHARLSMRSILLRLLPWLRPRPRRLPAPQAP